MRVHTVIGLAMLGGALAQAPQRTDTERVTAVLQSADPLRDQKAAAILLGPGVSLDAAIARVAKDDKTDHVVRRRALHLARALRLAQRLKSGQDRRDVGFWLALDEITREMPAAVRPFLLARSGMAPERLAAAEQELAAADAMAVKFCSEWNESQTLDDAHAEENRKYDALEAALKKVGLPAVPRLLDILTMPPEAAFTLVRSGDAEARRQVRALLALASVMQLEQALPYFVMHTGGPSLTLSSNAALAVQKFAGVDFGAQFLKPCDDAALLAWWKQHESEHRVVVDHLVHHLVAMAERDYSSDGAKPSVGLWSAVLRLDRALGRDRRPEANTGVELLRARLAELELQWLLQDSR